MDTKLLNEYEDMFQPLMDKVKVIYEDEQEWERKNNSYNIFQALGIERREVRLHSNFIYDLLNPYTSHQKSNILMKSFLSKVLNFSNEELENFDEDDYSFEKEVYAGEKGRIDFILYEKKAKFAHIIEMKIDAGDQDKQLKRYNTFAKKTYGSNNYALYYLTLDERDASFESLRDVEDYTNITFKNNISTWLEDSLSQMKVLPSAERNSAFENGINQYLMTVNKISGNIGTEMFEKKYLKYVTAENIQAIEQLAAYAEKIKNETLDKINEDICHRLQKEFPDLDLEIDKRLENDYVSIYIKKLEDLNNLSLGIIKEDSKLYFCIGVYNSEYKFLNGHYQKYVELFENIKGLKRDIEGRIYYQYIYAFPKDEYEILSSDNELENLKNILLDILIEKIEYLADYKEEN